MACFNPLDAWRTNTGITFKKHTLGEHLYLPCGQCKGCRLDRSQEWAVRCLHESSLHKQNSFITLTYNEKHLPWHEGLVKSDFQKFMKRLRRRHPGKIIRYYMVGEYGDQFGRPHFHALLFGHDFEDKEKWNTIRGNDYYRSQELEDLWNKGFSNISAVTFKSAAYVARYVMKKITGKLAENHYLKPDKYTGELIRVAPEYNAMSLKPGIAHDWYKQFKSDVFPSDNTIVNGRKIRTPRYYEKLLKKESPGTYDEIKQNRKEQAISHLANNTRERLKVREQVLIKRTQPLKRELQ